MSGKLLLFCTAPPETMAMAEKKILTKANQSRDDIIYFGPSGSSYEKKMNLNFISWGAGHFSLLKALPLFRQIKTANPLKAVIPMNNISGARYESISFFARLIAEDVTTMKPDGSFQQIKENLLWILLQPEPKFHAVIIAVLELFSPLFLGGLLKKIKIAEPPKNRLSMTHKTIKEIEKIEAPEVSVIIRTYNEEKYLKKTLEMVLAQEGPTAEVIIIDSESTDSTIDIAKKFPLRIFTIPKKSFSYGGSLNLGAKLANGNIIVNLSAHALPANKQWLKNLIAPLKDKAVGGVYGKELPIDGHAGLFEKKLLADAFGKKRLENKNNPFFSNANSAIPKSILLETAFDETVGWAEDQIWAARIQKKKYKTVYEPDAMVYHSHNLSMAQNFDRSFAYFKVLFRTINQSNSKEIVADYRSRLAKRAKEFRQFLTDNESTSRLPAFFYAPYCEFINYLGCKSAWRETKPD